MINILPFQLSWNQVITQNVYLYDFFGSCLTCLFFLIPDYQISVQGFLSDPLSMASLIFAHEISRICWIHMIASNLTVQANASEQLGTIKAREKNKKSYEQALVKRYHHLHEVKRIERHRHLPSSIYKVTVSWDPYACLRYTWNSWSDMLWDPVRNKSALFLSELFSRSPVHAKQVQSTITPVRRLEHVSFRCCIFSFNAILAFQDGIDLQIKCYIDKEAIFSGNRRSCCE